MTRRMIAFLLVAVMMVGMLPALTQAEEIEATVETDQVTVQADNELGQLLTQDFSQQQEQQTAGYTVTDLEISGNVATVTYDTLEEATLVVAVYSQDEVQLLASGKTQVSPEQTQATVTIEGNMPRYFQAAAYLLSSSDLSPLCPAYQTPMYTQAMQELLASTVEDYDQDRVLNLDEDPTTNFVVCGESTKLIQPAEGVNTVVLADSDAKSYIIENADQQITTLEAGDVFVYRYSETGILIVKVASISLEGTTATITGTDVDAREVFDTVKISGTADTEDMQVDTSVETEGVTYLGETTDAPQPRTWQDKTYHEASAEFDFNLVEDGEFSFIGKGKVEVLTVVEYYLSSQLQYFRYKVNFSLTGEFEIKVENDPEGLELPMQPLKFPVVPGVSLEFTPHLVAQISVSVTGKLGMETVIGVEAVHDGDALRFTNLCRTPSFTTELKLEGKLFIGLKLAPAVKILEGALVDAKIEGELGFELVGKLTTQKAEEELHDCLGCVDGDVLFKLKITPKVTLLNNEDPSLSVELVNFTKHLMDFYFCLEHDTFDYGECGRIKYKTRILVLDEREYAVVNARIMDQQRTPLGVTNSSGVLQTYLSPGRQTVYAQVGDAIYEVEVHVVGPTFLPISGVRAAANPEGGMVNFEQLFDALYDFEAAHNAEVVAGDQCGENVYWRFYSDGTLFFYGSGDMWGYEDEIPETVTESFRDYTYGANSLVMASGITGIAEGAFYECGSLRSVTLPNSLRTIGNRAFSYCGLQEITLPEGLEEIGDEAFYGNEFHDLILPDSLQSIGSRAFNSLLVVGIPAGVNSIADGAFEFCGPIYVHPDNHWYTSDEDGVLYDKEMRTLLQAPVGLKSYTVPLYVTRIGDWAFANSDVENVVVTTTVTDIGERAFYQCRNLKIVNIPDRVTQLRDYTFAGCSSLTGITLPEGLTSIGCAAFSGCSKLSSILIPEGVTDIGSEAFQSCRSLQEITIPQGVTRILDSTFVFCSNLTVVDIPDSVTVIDRQAFEFCKKLAVVNYGGSYSQWKSISIGNYNDPLTEATIYYNSEIYAPDTGTLSGTLDSRLVTSRAIFTGETQTEMDWETHQTSRFTGLVPGAEYVLVVLADVAAEDPLAAENLLYIHQAVAAEDGTLEFRYIHRTFAERSYALVCGASNKDLANAQIRFPEVYAAEALTAIRPTVVYDGTVLTEGVDYVLLGDAAYSEAGVYTCSIRGIHHYTGLVTCSYTVLAEGASLGGSVTSFGSETEAVTLRLLEDGKSVFEAAVYECAASYRLEAAPGSYTLEVSKANHVPKEYPLTLEAGDTIQDVKLHLLGDVNGNGKVNVADVSMVYAYSKKSGQLSEYELLCADVTSDGRVNVADTSRLYAHATKKNLLW